MAAEDPGWVELGDAAFGLVQDARLTAVLYRQGGFVGEDEGSEPGVFPGGYFVVASEQPDEHVFVAESNAPWRAAREAAAAELDRGEA